MRIIEDFQTYVGLDKEIVRLTNSHPNNSGRYRESSHKCKTNEQGSNFCKV